VSSHKASQRPDGWEAVALDELISFVIGGDWGKAPNYEHEDYTEVFCIRGTEIKRWRQEKGATAALRRIKKASLEKRMLNEGDIILEVSGGGPEQPVGRVELVDAQALAQNSDTPKICTNFFRRMVPTEGINAPYLVHYLKYFYSTGDIKNYQAGSNNLRNLKFNEYKRLRVPLPPLNEQHRIVEKIETLFARIDKGEEALREVQKLLKRYRQSILKAAVTGELTRDWRKANQHKLEPASDFLARILETRRENWQGRGKYTEPVEPDTAALPILPANWQWASLGQLLHTIEAGKNYRCLERPPEGNEFGIVKISAVTWEDFDEEESKTVTDADRVNPRYLIKKGDLLMSRANTIELVGASVVVDRISKQLQLSDKVLRLKLVVPLEDWVNTVLKSPIGRQQIEAFATGAQMSMRNISQKNIERIAIPLPSQNEVGAISAAAAGCFEKSRALRSFCAAELTRSSALRQSILKSAFNGQLVPQDPNDEPASKLLARIRAEREAMPKAKARRKARG